MLHNLFFDYFFFSLFRLPRWFWMVVCWVLDPVFWIQRFILRRLARDRLCLFLALFCQCSSLLLLPWGDPRAQITRVSRLLEAGLGQTLQRQKRLCQDCLVTLHGSKCSSRNAPPSRSAKLLVCFKERGKPRYNQRKSKSVYDANLSVTMTTDKPGPLQLMRPQRCWHSGRLWAQMVLG